MKRLVANSQLIAEAGVLQRIEMRGPSNRQLQCPLLGTVGWGVVCNGRFQGQLLLNFRELSGFRKVLGVCTCTSDEFSSIAL